MRTLINFNGRYAGYIKPFGSGFRAVSSQRETGKQFDSARAAVGWLELMMRSSSN